MSFTVQFEDFAGRLREFIRRVTEGAVSSAKGADDPNFDNLALELFALQFEYNYAYRLLCNARGVSPEKVKQWADIPAVPAAAFKELELSCLPPGQRTTAFHSSGTTEQRPSRHFHSAQSLALYEASLWPWFARHLYAATTVAAPTLLLLTPPPEEAPHSSLVHMFECIRRQSDWAESAFLGTLTSDATWMLNFEAALDHLERAISAGQPAILLGTAFSFVHLLDFLAEQEIRLNLPPGSRVMETGGYKGRSRSLPQAELHRLLTARLGVPAAQIVCEYGMSELSSQAYDHVAGTPLDMKGSGEVRHFRFPPWVRVQIVSPETGQEVAEGETGLIRVFDLANVCSVVAIQTEDLGIPRGAGFELAGRMALAEPRGCSLMAK